MAIFKADTLPERLEAKVNTCIGLIDILGFSQKNFKNCQKTVVIIFEIEIDSSLFIARLPIDKLKKAIGDKSKVLGQKAISFIDIESLIRFFSFCSQAVKLSRVFMRKLWDFINHYSHDVPRSTLRRIPA